MIRSKTKLGFVDSAEDVTRNYIAKEREIELLNQINKFLIKMGFDSTSSIRLLRAHGNSDNGIFQFVHYPSGKRKSEKVSDWISCYDGKYDALVVLSCNTMGVDLSSHRSLLMYPRGLVSDFDCIHASSDGVYYNGLHGDEVFIVKDPRVLHSYLRRRPIKLADLVGYC